MAWEITEIKMADDLVDCNPALDFVGDKSIVTVRSKAIVKRELETKSQNPPKPKKKMEQIHYSILYNGNGKADTFFMNEDTLAEHKLFYAGRLDISGNRWNIDDIYKFRDNPTSLTVSEIYKLIFEKYDYYYEFADDRLYWVLAAFTIYSYFFPIFNHAPILHLFGDFRTGKTKLCQLIEAMCFNPLNSSNISASTVFRTVQGARSLIILDESEDLVQDEKRKDIVNMLLAGVNKSGRAYRQEKSANDNYQTRSYQVFSPKVIANINGINLDSLSSRIIRVNTSGTVNKEKKNRDVDLESNEWQEIRNQLYRLLLIKHAEVREVKETLKIEGLSGRWHNMWFGILVMAKLCSDRLYGNMLNIAIELSEEMETQFVTETPSRLIIQHLVKLIKENGKESYTSDELYKSFNYDEKRDMDFVTKKGMGMLMTKIGLKSKPTRISSEGLERIYTFTLDWLESRLKMM